LPRNEKNNLSSSFECSKSSEIWIWKNYLKIFHFFPESLEIYLKIQVQLKNKIPLLLYFENFFIYPQGKGGPPSFSQFMQTVLFSLIKSKLLFFSIYQNIEKFSPY